MKDMTNEQLIGKWQVGCDWLTKHEQITGTKKNNLGENYDHRMYLMALKRLEEIEDEIKRRALNYGQE